ncbi:MAG: cation diffusion facilitator family transporter [Campylobacterales bacterium]
MSLERSATIVATFTAALLAIVKFIVGALSGSIAVMASAIDSLLDLLVSMFNYIAITNSEKPADGKFNYGRGKFEAMASFIEGAVISGSGLFILYESIKKLALSEAVINVDISIYVMIFSFIVTTILVLFLNYVAKKKNSLVIKSDALHYKTDMYTNGGVLITLFVVQFTDFHAIDGIVGAMIALYIIYSASSLIKESFFMLTDRALDDSMVEEIENIITSQKKISGYHYLKTRRSGNNYFLDVHLVFNRDMLLVDAHSVSDAIEEEVSKLGDENTKWNFNVHLDPCDDSDDRSLLPSKSPK